MVLVNDNVDCQQKIIFLNTKIKCHFSQSKTDYNEIIFQMKYCLILKLWCNGSNNSSILWHTSEWNGLSWTLGLIHWMEQSLNAVEIKGWDWCRWNDITRQKFAISLEDQVYFSFMHLTEAFIQSNLQCIQAIQFFISMCVLWELNPQPFALLTQWFTTEPQEQYDILIQNYNINQSKSKNKT